MNNYEFKKLQVEFKRVNAGREEQEMRIMELQEQIQRLEASIVISIAREEELKVKIAEMQKQG